MRTHKAQALTPDFVVSFVIFLMVVSLSINLWNVANDKELWIRDIEDMHKKARTITDILITNTGSPVGWDNETVVFLGFAEEDHVLNKTKLLSFKNTEYARAKSLMNLGANDFNLTMHYKNGTVIMIDNKNITYGTDYSEGDYIIHSERIALINNSGNLISTKINLVLWRKL